MILYTLQNRLYRFGPILTLNTVLLEKKTEHQ